jgi:hypothetical protein
VARRLAGGAVSWSAASASIFDAHVLRDQQPAASSGMFLVMPGPPCWGGFGVRIARWPQHRSAAWPRYSAAKLTGRMMREGAPGFEIQ